MRDLPCTISRSDWAVWLHKIPDIMTGDPTHASVTLTGNTNCRIEHTVVIGCYAERERRLLCVGIDARQGPQGSALSCESVNAHTVVPFTIQKSGHKLKEASQIV
jgi:hypothetical protein